MFRRILVRTTKIRHQQLLTTQHVQRQIAVLVIVPVEGPSRLMTVHRIIGRVEVQNHLLGTARERGDELFEQFVMNRNRPLTLGAPLESAQRRRTRQGPVATTRGLDHQIVSKGVVVVRVFVSQRQSMHPLAQHRQHPVANLPALASVAEAERHLGGQPQPAVYLAQQQRTAMRGNRTAGEIRPHPPPAAA